MSLPSDKQKITELIKSLDTFPDIPTVRQLGKELHAQLVKIETENSQTEAIRAAKDNGGIVSADSGGWILKSSDAGGTGGLTRGSGAGVAIPSVSDTLEFLMAIDRASSGAKYYFTRSDGVPIKAYPSDRKKGSIVIERAAGNWVRLNASDAGDLRLKLVTGKFGSKFKCDQCDSQFGKEEELLSHAKQSHGVDVQDYNIESGKDYSGQSKFKSIAVELQVSDVKVTETRYWINELTNQYADLVVTNVEIKPDRITFNIGSPSMEDLTADDIKFRIDEYLTMNISPFECKQVRIA